MNINKNIFVRICSIGALFLKCNNTDNSHIPDMIFKSVCV